MQKPLWQDMGVFQITLEPYLDSDQKDVGWGGGVHEGGCDAGCDWPVADKHSVG